MNTQELRALALAATPGPWSVHTEEVLSPIVAAMELSKLVYGTAFTPVLPMVVGSNGLATAVTGCGPTSVSNAAYIAAASPDAIIAILDAHDRLLDALERKGRFLQQALDALEIAHNGLRWYADTYPESLNGCDDEASEQINGAIEAITRECTP